MREGGSRLSPGPGPGASGAPQQAPELALHDTGSGPSLLLLHAFPSTRPSGTTRWRPSPGTSAACARHVGLRLVAELPTLSRPSTGTPRRCSAAWTRPGWVSSWRWVCPWAGTPRWRCCARTERVSGWCWPPRGHRRHARAGEEPAPDGGPGPPRRGGDGPPHGQAAAGPPGARRAPHRRSGGGTDPPPPSGGDRRLPGGDGVPTRQHATARLVGVPALVIEGDQDGIVSVDRHETRPPCPRGERP